jgi:hypothetical protein
LAFAPAQLSPSKAGVQSKLQQILARVTSRLPAFRRQHEA